MVAKLVKNLRNRLRNQWILFFVCSISPSLTLGQSSYYEEYIKEHLHWAQENMEKYGIPVSITLSQALLESDAGRSNLAKKGNNHFGIKAKSDWKGKVFRMTDDRPNEAFCSYHSIKDSYQHHGAFLQRSFYKPLYNLSITDYKGWAKGLQDAGYATNKRYAQSLIRLIEQHELYRYDYGMDTPYLALNHPSIPEEKNENVSLKENSPFYIRQTYLSCGLLYIEAYDGDTFTSIANDFGFDPKLIAKYNELPLDYALTNQHVVYFQKKNKMAFTDKKTHIVRSGESMYDISQIYGVQLKYLYKINNMKMDKAVQVGMEININ